MSVKIIIDSASDISEKEAKKLGIVMLPISITFGDEEFLDGVNLLPNEFYEKLAQSKVVPKTSLVNTFRFKEAFEEHTKSGDEVVVITLSSKLSGTYKCAKEAAQEFSGKVFVVDSLNACIGERLLGLYALQLAKEGKSASEIASELDVSKKRINVIAMINTLEYLKRGGRISAAAAFAGKLLGIKPLIGVIDGEVKVIGKAMGTRNGGALLNKLIAEKNGFDLSMPHGVVWSGNDRSMLDKYVKESAQLWGEQAQDVPAYILGCTIGSHIGPGAVGVAFFEKNHK